MVAAVCVLTALAVDLRRTRSHVYEDVLRDVHSLSRAFEEHASQTLGRVAIYLDALSSSLDAPEVLTGPALREFLQARLPAIPDVVGTMILDRDGTVVAMSGARAALDRSYGDQPFFRVHLAGAGPAVFAGDPVRIGTEMRGVLPVSRRLATDDGRFLGVAVALFDPQSFTRFYGTFAERADLTINLITRAGRIVARTPDPMHPLEFGARLFAAPDVPSARTGVGDAVDDVTGAPCIHVFRQVADTNLIVSIGLPAFEPLDPRLGSWWRHAAAGAGFVLLIAALCVILLKYLAHSAALRATATRARLLASTQAAHITVLNTIQAQVVAARDAAEQARVAAETRHRERIEMRARLEHAQAMIALAVDAAALGTWSLDSDGAIRVWSERTKGFFGLSPDLEFTRETFWNTIHPEDLAAVRRAVDHSIATGAPCEIDMRVCPADAPVRWCRIRGRPLLDVEGRASRLVGVMFDIDDRVQAEQARQHLAAIVENSTDAIIGQTLEGVITTWNQAAEATFGYPAEEAVGRSIALIASPDPDAVVPGTRGDELVARYEAVCRHKDGRALDVSLTVSPIRDQAGAVVGVSTIAQDISDRKRGEAERLDLIRRLLRVQEDERAHLARELHDGLGQHLSALSLGLKRLEPAILGASDRALVDALQASVSQLGRDVHRTAWALRPTALDDFGLRQAVLNFIGDWSARAGIHCDVHWPELEAGRLPRDVETAVYRSVQEALTNAQRHARTSRVSVVVECRDQTLQVIVEDHGVGFDVQRAQANTARRLGLAGIRERLALVGGTLTIESVPDVGTTLFMRIGALEGELAA